MTPSAICPINRRQKGDEVYILCLSEGREEKDRVIPQTHEQRLKKDLEPLKARVEKGQLKTVEKIHLVLGRLKECYPRVARYYRVDYDTERKTFNWQEDSKMKAIAEKLDGGYVLKSDREDLAADETWRSYILLTRVEARLPGNEEPPDGEVMKPVKTWHELPTIVTE